jgi:hypothetical protein
MAIPEIGIIDDIAFQMVAAKWLVSVLFSISPQPARVKAGRSIREPVE